MGLMDIVKGANDLAGKGLDLMGMDPIGSAKRTMEDKAEEKREEAASEREAAQGAAGQVMDGSVNPYGGMGGVGQGMAGLTGGLVGSGQNPGTAQPAVPTEGIGAAQALDTGSLAGVSGQGSVFQTAEFDPQTAQQVQREQNTGMEM